MTQQKDKQRFALRHRKCLQQMVDQKLLMVQAQAITRMTKGCPDHVQTILEQRLADHVQSILPLRAPSQALGSACRSL